jgi:hypothetical protein
LNVSCPSCDWVPKQAWLEPTLAELRAPASVDHITFDETLVQINLDCDSIPGIPAVVQVIAAVGVVDIHVIVVVPIV